MSYTDFVKERENLEVEDRLRLIDELAREGIIERGEVRKYKRRIREMFG